MAKTQPRRRAKQKKEAFPEAELPQRINYILLLVGAFTVLLGMIVMSTGDDISAASVTIAPLILVVAYCGIIPLAILYKKKSTSKTLSE